MLKQKQAGLIQLRPLSAKDAIEVEQWPSYAAEFEGLDYALREEGWLAEFRDKPDTWIYAAERTGELAAFTILSMTAPAEAEYRIALRADHCGEGLGKVITARTLETGFDELGLKRIHLIVRKNNPRAIGLYQRLNFSRCGECRRTVNGKLEFFLMMELFCKDFIR